MYLQAGRLAMPKDDNTKARITLRQEKRYFAKKDERGSSAQQIASAVESASIAPLLMNGQGNRRVMQVEIERVLQSSAFSGGGAVL